jgi:hypothetical protein
VEEFIDQITSNNEKDTNVRTNNSANAARCAALVGLCWCAAISTLNAETHYVNPASPAPTAPYDTWDTAAWVIQDAVNIASSGDKIVVTNGVYDTGGQVICGLTTNRVAVVGPFTVRSVNGPTVTIIRGS